MQPHMRSSLPTAERNDGDASAGMFCLCLVISFLVPCLAQHGPCYTCEEYHLSHPHSHPYQQIRGQCHYPCNCQSETIDCPEGVTPIIDGCNCCPMCAKQRGEKCNKIQLCDHKHNLECIYKTPFSSYGRCVDKMAGCKTYSSQWSECSTTCGYGLSFRISNDNPQCQLRNESRICQIRNCELPNAFPSSTTAIHRHRLHRNCRATVKPRIPVRLTDQDNCTSIKNYFPSYCSRCEETCCKPQAATTIMVPFQCPSGTYIERNVMWILRCSCLKGLC